MSSFALDERSSTFTQFCCNVFSEHSAHFVFQKDSVTLHSVCIPDNVDRHNK